MDCKITRLRERAATKEQEASQENLVDEPLTFLRDLAIGRRTTPSFRLFHSPHWLAFVRTRELDPVLDWLLGSVLHLLKADAGSIMLLSPSGDQLHVTAAPRNLSIRSVAGLLLRNQRTVLLRGRAADHGPKRAISARPRDLASGVATPLRVGDRLLGVLNASRAPGARRINRESLGLLELLANHTAILIDSAQSMTRELVSTRKARCWTPPARPWRSSPPTTKWFRSTAASTSSFIADRPELVDLEFPLQLFLNDAEHPFEDLAAFAPWWRPRSTIRSNN